MGSGNHIIDVFWTPLLHIINVFWPPLLLLNLLPHMI